MPFPITRETIESLMDEAELHRDFEMRNICQDALAGDSEKWAECVRVIEEARASGWGKYEPQD
jgi:hypothetical protein